MTAYNPRAGARCGSWDAPHSTVKVYLNETDEGGGMQWGPFDRCLACKAITSVPPGFDFGDWPLLVSAMRANSSADSWDTGGVVNGFGLDRERHWFFVSEYELRDLAGVSSIPITKTAAEIKQQATKTALYRWFDIEGRLLYVGVSLNAAVRASGHKRSAPWFDQITRMDVEWFPDWCTAHGAEIAAIVSEKPLHNKQHNK